MKNDQRQNRIQREIDENLRKVYDEALQEDIPDRFHDLLAQLRAKEQAKEDKELPE